MTRDNSGTSMNAANFHSLQPTSNWRDLVDKSVKQAARLFHEGNLAACQLLIGQTIKIDPDNDEALQIAGLLKLRVGDAKAALPALEKARRLNPSNPDHHNNLALAYARTGRYDDAIKCLRDALRMAPGRSVFWTNLAVQLRSKANFQPSANREDQIAEAEEALKKAVEIDGQASAYANLGSLYAERRDMKTAEEHFQKALEKDPSLSGVHVDLSYVYFLQGDFEKGWPHYEYRMSHYPQAARWEKIFPKDKRWDGKSSLEDKNVCVFCEQGCGDAIHFARYLPLLKTRTLSIYCHDPLVGLLGQFGSTFPMGGPIPKHDIAIPIMSLPFLLGNPKVETPYITPPPPPNLESYGELLKVGICWAGNPQHPGDRFRSIPISEFRPLKIPGVALFSLQKDYRPRKYHDGDDVVDLCKDGPNVVDLSNLLSSFNDTASFIMGMDLVVTVDTAVLHLAGALGKKTWALIPYNPDWRWGLEGSQSPIYQSVEIFRQPEKHGWAEVFQNMANRLQETLRCKYSAK